MSKTPIADMIAEMHASGIQLDMIIVAVRSIERAMSTRQGVDEVAEKRRAWDREYRRNKRERPPDPPDIHPNPPDVGVAALSSLEKKDSYSEVVSKKERKARGEKLPPDWKPNQHHYDEGEKRGLNRAAVDECADRMRSWCKANANRSITTKADWDAAFMGAWLKDSRNGTSSVRTNSASGPAQTRDATFIAAMGRTLERRRAARAADDAGRQDLREDGCAGTAARADAERAPAPGDAESSGQLAFLPVGHARR